MCKKFGRIKVFEIIIAVCICAFVFGGTTPVSAKDADGDYVIIIDAGHGSGDPGAVSVNGDNEAYLNWNISVALKAELETYAGVKVYITRGSAEPFSNTGRGCLGEKLGADYAISIHNNSGSSTASGVVCFGTVNEKYKMAAQKMCNYIAAEVAPYVGWAAANGYNTRESEYYDGTSKVDYYTFIDEAVKCGIPALIVEHCYLSNASNSAFIYDINNQYKLGYADATGIAKCLGLSKRMVAAGSQITLTRTYSAVMTGVSGTFTSSNNSVCRVRSDGTITAVGAGNAVVTCTTADGNRQMVNVTVPEVKMVGIAAGLTPTMYTTWEQVLAFKKNMVVVKAIYSDGSASQVMSGISVGNPVRGETKNYPFYDSKQGVNAITLVNVPVSYSGFTCNLKLYYGPKLFLGNYSSSNYTPSGANSDILHIPAGYTSVAGSTVPGPTPPETIAPPPTQAQTKESEPETTTEYESSSEDESSGHESSSEVESQKESESVPENVDRKHIAPWLIVLLVVFVLVIIIIVAMVIMNIYKNKRRKKRRPYKKRKR